MKQILFAALAAVAVLTSSCSKDNGGGEPEPASPIQGLEMPASSAENPIIAGTTVNLKGVGFTASDEIWFGAPTKASVEVKAEGLKLTATGISFTAPSINGEASITLKQAGKEYALGKMYFSKDEHLYAITRTGSGFELGEYNLADGIFKPVFNPTASTSCAIADDHYNIYYIDHYYSTEVVEDYLMRYNLIEKKEVRLITFKDDYISIGMIDGKLHLMRQDETNGFSLMSVADDGKESVVKTFGQLPDAGYQFREDVDPQFVYDAASKSVIVAGKYEDLNNHYYPDPYVSLHSFSLEAGVITTKHHFNDPNRKINTLTWFNIAKTDVGVLLFTTTNTWSRTVMDRDTEVGKTVITYINPTTLANISDVAMLPYEFDRPSYIASKNMLMGVDDNVHVHCVARSYDLATRIGKQINSTESFRSFFTMSY